MKKWIVSLALLWSVAAFGMAYATPGDQDHGHQSDQSHNKIQSESTTKRVLSIYNTKGEVIGKAIVVQEGNGVRVLAKVAGLTPGKHGFHIHEKLFKGFDFDTAGEHLNPGHRQHGFDNPKGFHLGDMTNMEVREDGVGEGNFLIEGANMAKNSPQSLLGRSIIIHKDEDDYKTDPAGNSGPRIAGGNIQ